MRVMLRSMCQSRALLDARQDESCGKGLGVHARHRASQRITLLCCAITLLQCGGKGADAPQQVGGSSQTNTGGSVAAGGSGGSLGGTVMTTSSGDAGLPSSSGGSMGGISVAAGGSVATAGHGGVTLPTGGKTDVPISVGGAAACNLTVDPLGAVATQAHCSCISRIHAGGAIDPVPGDTPDPPPWGGAGGSVATTATACPAGTSTTVSATVGPDGGTITMSNTPATAGAPLTLTILPNALSETVTIRITETTSSSVDGIAQWSPIYHFEPEALTLSIPAIVEVPFMVGNTAAELEQKIYWSGASNTCTLTALGDSRVYGQFTRASVTRLGWGLNGLLLPKDGSTCDPPP